LYIQAGPEEGVMAAYSAPGFALLARHFDAPWVTHTLQKQGKHMFYIIIVFHISRCRIGRPAII
jgi:hypothetical protein